MEIACSGSHVFSASSLLKLSVPPLTGCRGPLMKASASTEQVTFEHFRLLLHNFICPGIQNESFFGCAAKIPMILLVMFFLTSFTMVLHTIRIWSPVFPCGLLTSDLLSDHNCFCDDERLSRSSDEDAESCSGGANLLQFHSLLSFGGLLLVSPLAAILPGNARPSAHIGNHWVLGSVTVLTTSHVTGKWTPIRFCQKWVF